MKKIKYILLLLFIFIGIGNINAACDDEVLVSESELIDAGYYVDLGENYNNHKAKIYVNNIPENVYIIVVNNTLNERKVYKEFKEGALLIEAPNLTNSYDYTIRAYSSSTSCENELLKTFNVKTPLYNSFSASKTCTDLINKGYTFEGCDMYTLKSYTEKTFESDLKAYLSKAENSNPEEKVKELFYKYYYYFLIPVAVLGLYYVIRLNIIRSRRKKREKEQKID